MADDGIITAMEKQLDCYRRLAKLAEIQHEHVERSHTEGLLEVLTLRQQVLEQIGALEQTVGPARRKWSEYLLELPAGQRATAEGLMAEVRRLLEWITAADRDDALILQQRKLNLGHQINQAKAARQVNRAYAAASYGSSVSRMDVQR